LSEVIWIESYEEFTKETESGKVVVDFTAPAWCQPCIRFAPHYDRAAAEAPEIKFLAVDVDKNDWAMAEYDIKSVPTVLLFEDGAFSRQVKAPQGAVPFLNDIRS
jgi:thioredoxin 1